MANYRAELETSAPIETAFEYLADFSNARSWDPSVVSAHELGIVRTGFGRAASGLQDALDSLERGQVLDVPDSGGRS